MRPSPLSVFFCFPVFLQSIFFFFARATIAMAASAVSAAAAIVSAWAASVRARVGSAGLTGPSAVDEVRLAQAEQQLAPRRSTLARVRLERSLLRAGAPAALSSQDHVNPTNSISSEKNILPITLDFCRGLYLWAAIGTFFMTQQDWPMKRFLFRPP